MSIVNDSDEDLRRVARQYAEMGQSLAAELTEEVLRLRELQRGRELEQDALRATAVVLTDVREYAGELVTDTDDLRASSIGHLLLHLLDRSS